MLKSGGTAKREKRRRRRGQNHRQNIIELNFCIKIIGIISFTFI